MIKLFVLITRYTKQLKSMLIIILFGCSLVSSAKSYYIDSGNGNDENNGTNAKSAWRSLEKVNSWNFNPGDTMFFLRDSEWTGGLIIKSSGTESKPIVYTSYGKGSAPVIKNPGVDSAVAIKINADWLVVENFMVCECHASGIRIDKGAGHNIIRNNEATQVGLGIEVIGSHNLITKNYVHNLLMVVNNPGGDDDYGAVGVTLEFSSNNEVSYNRMINCKAPSLDYGFDGGMVEFYGNVDSCYVHHNWGENCEGTFEVGGSKSLLSNNIIAYNICINNGDALAGGFHVGGKFGVSIENFRIENNVFADTSHSDYAIGFWNGTPRTSDFIYRNNIFYIPNYKRVSNETGFIHESNLYYLGGKMNIGIEPGPGDKTGDPLFQNFTEKDFHLKAGSPAIDAGVNLKYTTDFDNSIVPKGAAPDIGAFEYGTSPAGKTGKIR